jgi:TonB-linked SusC/RagA family outer membrane protein
MKKLLQSLFILLCIATSVMAQNRTITGTVTSKEDGLPIPGVSVKVKGSNVGVSTSANGKYSLSVPVSATILEFSSIGFATQSLAIGSGNVINVSLGADSKALNEVVVTSFGIERSKKSLGYGASTVSSTELNTAKAPNITNALAAKVPGVRVNGAGGAFTGSSVIIRGFTTFTGSNQPLYVIDGVPIDNSGGGQNLQSGASSSNRASDINAEDIENITVLKGAAATVLYGSRAASGAILITTKKGTKGAKNNIVINSSYNVGEVNRLPEYQNEYAQGNNGVYNPGNINSTAGGLALGGGTGATTSWGPRITGQTVTNFFGQQEVLTAFPNNISDIFQTAHNAQNNVSFSGGGDKSTFRLSYGNLNETYVLANNRLNRNNVTFNGSTKVTEKLTVGASFTYTANNSKRTGQGNQLSNPLFRAYFTPRSYDLTNIPFENATGQQLWYGAEDHPYWSIKYNKYKEDLNRIYGNINARYDILDWLHADIRIGSDFYNRRSKSFDEIGNRGGGFTGSTGRLVGGILDAENGVRNLNSYVTVTGVKQYGDFNVSATIGNEITQNYSYSSSVTGYTLAVAGYDNLQNATTFFPSKGSSMSRLIGYFGDLVVDYRNYLTLNVKARNDYSSTLTKENRSIFYPAAAISFQVTEAFPSIKSNYVNLIKIRANIGEVGKGAGVYQTDTYYSKSSAGDGFTTGIIFPYNGLTAFTLNNGAGQPNITPEFTREMELGGEFAFFNNRLTVDGSYYVRKTRSVILSVPVSAAAGITSVVMNAGKLSTKGVELLVGGTPLKTKDFSWDISVNFTKYKSMVDELADGVSVITLGGFTTPNVRLVAGEEYGSIYGTAYQRNAQGQLLLTATGLPQATSAVQKIGNPNPDWTAGVQSNINYKNFSLSVVLDKRQGGDQYSRNIADVQRNGVAAETADLPRYDGAGVLQNNRIYEGIYASNGQPNTTMISSQLYYGNTGKYVAAEGFIYDTTWFRIREAALSYRLPKSALTRTPFGNVEVGVFGRNLFLHAPNYPHFDPEQNALGVSNAQGLEFNSLPNTRTYGINLRLTL